MNNCFKFKEYLYFILFLVVFSGCEKESPSIPLEGITLKNSEGEDLGEKLEIDAFKVTPLIVVPDPPNATEKNVVWSVGEEEIIELETSSSGLVAGIKGVKGGTVSLKITSKIGNHEAKVLTTVKYIEVERIEFDKSSFKIFKNYTEKLLVSFFPNDASNKALRWSSSDKAIAIVDSKGVVKAKKKGKAVITVVGDDDKTASIEVEVIDCVGITISPRFNTPCTISGTAAYNLTKLVVSGGLSELNYIYEDAIYPPSNYKNITNKKIVLSKGGTFDIEVTHSNTWSKSLVWIDWNGDGDFDDLGEFVSQLGKDSQKNPKVNKIEKINTFPCLKGGETKIMRIQTIDAWSNPKNCGEIYNSGAKDFLVEIQ